MEHKAPWLFCWAAETSPERPVHDPQAGTGRDSPHSPERWAERGLFPAQEGPAGAARIHPHRRQINPQTNQSHGAYSPMAFLLGGGGFAGTPRVIVRRRAQARDSPYSLERGRGGASRVVPAQTRAAYSLGRIPIGGSFGISNRSDKKSVFYKSVSQPL